MKYFQDKGYEMHVATKLGERRTKLDKQGIICHNINFSRSINLLITLKALIQLIKLMRENRFSLVHVHTPMAAFLGRLAAKLTHTRPILYTAHGFHFYKGAPWYYWVFIYPAEYLAARWTNGLIVMNQEDYLNAQRMRFKPNKNLFLVHGVGVDLKEFINVSFSNGEIKKELDIKEKDIIISCVAEFIPRKNHIFLLKSWEKITKEFNNIHLLLVSGKGKCLGTLKKQVEKDSLPRVYFLGYRNDIPQILNETDIITLVSKHEGLPRSIMEAMSSGKPAIVSNVRGNCDLVEQGKNGFLVNLGDMDGLISSMKKLITNDKLRNDMGKASLEIIKEYDIEKVLAEMSSIYDYYLKKY
jgi:glycosyltransferase involved in cell wall biosynthesis